MKHYQKTVLVTGGAGYIGSHMVKYLDEIGYRVVILDNLSTGHDNAMLAGKFIQGDVGDVALLETLFQTYHIDAVIHLAGLSITQESFQYPQRYFKNNVTQTLTLLDSLIKHDVYTFIFSSSAAVYGEPKIVPIPESHPLNPLSPYGETKLLIEKKLKEYHTQAGLNYGILRYFNAAGCDPSGILGERHEPETHLIPKAIHVTLGLQPALKIYGTDYGTPDGTCIRDYVHVNDLCQAHHLLLEHLWKTPNTTERIFNVGHQKGYSVKDVIKAIELITRKSLSVEIRPRRPGDSSILLANSEKLRLLLHWSPRYCLLSTMIQHMLNFRRGLQD